MRGTRWRAVKNFVFANLYNRVAKKVPVETFFVLFFSCYCVCCVQHAYDTTCRPLRTRRRKEFTSVSVADCNTALQC